MSEQLIFNFPFKKNYLKQDFYVSKNNFNAFKLIESWPKWPSRLINIFGPRGCGKTHLINILKSKIQSVIDELDKSNDQSHKLICSDFNKPENLESSLLDELNDLYMLITSISLCDRFRLDFDSCSIAFSSSS